MSLFEDSEDSLDEDESDCEEMVSSESLSDTKNSFLDLFLYQWLTWNKFIQWTISSRNRETNR